MPNIIDYTATGEITPSDKGIQGAVDAGRRVGLFYRQIGSDIHQATDAVQQHMAVMETSELYTTGAELKINLQKRYEEESALPDNRNDPHFADRFMGEVAPLIEQWGESAKTDHGKLLAAQMGASIKNEVFNHVAAGQAEMDTAHVEDNLTQLRNTLASGLALDPSEPNLRRTLGTWNDAVDGMTSAIPDVSARERVAAEMKSTVQGQLVLRRYAEVGNSIENQIAATGGETSPALEQLKKDVSSQLGFEYLSPEAQSKIAGLGEDSVRRGQELFNSKNATAKSQMTEAGKAAYAELHNVITNLALNGQGPTPDLITAAQDYARKYGPTNPGEVASLDDFIVRGQDRAQSNAVQPYNQQTRDSIQAGFALPTGDPRRPTLASLAKAYSHGQITKEDFTGYSEILNKLDKPTEDPSFAPAWQNFQRWQSQMIQSIGAGNAAAGPARAQFLHDSTAAFMVQGKGGGGWDKALDTITNAQSPYSFGRVIKFYQDATTKGDASSVARWLQQHDQFNPGPYSAPAYGSKAAPVYPTAPTAAPTKEQPTKVDQKAVDDMIWGKH